MLTKPLLAHDKGKAACNMVGGFEGIIEEFQAMAKARGREYMGPNKSIVSLMNNLKFSRFYEQLGLTKLIHSK